MKIENAAKLFASIVAKLFDLIGLLVILKASWGCTIDWNRKDFIVFIEIIEKWISKQITKFYSKFNRSITIKIWYRFLIAQNI